MYDQDDTVSRAEFEMFLAALKNEGFFDSSYKNDVNPSLMWVPFPDADYIEVQVFIGEEDKTRREVLDRIMISILTADEGAEPIYISIPECDPTNADDMRMLVDMLKAAKRRVVASLPGLEICAFGMVWESNGDSTLAQHRDAQPDYYDVWLRCNHPTQEGLVEVLVEYEDLNEEEAWKRVAELEEAYPDAAMEGVI